MAEAQDIGQAVPNSPLTTPKIKLFGGQKDTTSTAVGAKEVINWLEAFEEQADAMKWSDRDKVERISSLLVGPAKEWYKMYVKTRIQIRRIPIWTDFKKQMKSFFLPLSHKYFVMRALEARMQKEAESVTNNILTKKRLYLKSEPSMPESPQVYYCVKGLLPHLRNDVTSQGPIKMEDLLGIAKRSESAHDDDSEVTMVNYNPYLALAVEATTMHQEEMVQLKKELEETMKLFQELSTAQNRARTREKSPHYRASDNRDRYRPNNLYPRDRSQDRYQGRDPNCLCLYCGKGNHYIADCRKKQKDQRQVAFANRPQYYQRNVSHFERQRPITDNRLKIENTRLQTKNQVLLNALASRAAN